MNPKSSHDDQAPPDGSVLVPQPQAGGGDSSPSRGEALVPGQTIATARSGRTVRLSVSLGEERLEIIGPRGMTELSVILTENGPKLVFESADIQIVSANRVAVECGTFEVKAREQVAVSGATASIAARHGDVKIEANDRVSLIGEQIRLNCDNPDEVPPWMQRELAARLAATVMPSLVPRRDRTGNMDETPEQERNGSVEDGHGD